MKPALRYALVTAPYSSFYRVVAVTTERRGRSWGRDADTLEPTNFAARQEVATFHTEDGARQAVARAAAKRQELMPGVQKAEAEAHQARAQMNTAIRNAARGYEAERAA